MSSLLSLPKTELVPGDRARLTTTVRRLGGNPIYAQRATLIARGIRYEPIGRDKPIHLLTILDVCGAEECLRAMRATEQSCERQARLIVADFAEAALLLVDGRATDRDHDESFLHVTEIARKFARGTAPLYDLAAAGVFAKGRGGAWRLADRATWEFGIQEVTPIAFRYLAELGGEEAGSPIIRRYLMTDEEAA